MATQPATNPTKAFTFTPTAGLWLGTPDAYTFDGWFAPEATTPFNFSTPITANITLTAKWTAPSTTPIDVSGQTGIGYFAKAVTYVKANANAGAYTLLINANYDCAPQTLDENNINLTIEGLDTMRNIRLSANGILFTVGKSGKTGISLTLGNNITLVGRTNGVNEATADNTNAVVTVLEGAAFTMLEGSKVTGNTNSGASTYGAAVYVNDAGSVFTMEAGAITGNTSTYSSATGVGGVVLGAGRFEMNGGSVSGNTGNSGDVLAYSNTSYTISGNAAIGTLTLIANATANASVTVASGWNGSVTSLNLQGSNAALNTVITYWYDATTPKTVLQAATGYTLTAADVAKFPLGKVMNNTTFTRKITGNATGTDNYLITSEGKLVKDE
jgi:uncharacterized repeat protein (TIGR02543 family)